MFHKVGPWGSRNSSMISDRNMTTNLKVCLLAAVLILTGTRHALSSDEVNRCADLIAEADSLIQIGYLEAALDRAQSAVDLSDSSFGQKNSMTAMAMSALGAVYWAKGDPASAEKH
ncbi:tetratricopeptide repeat protein, partial [bacterium]|nr:tetratricopeptide repeat protein [bacterium]